MFANLFVLCDCCKYSQASDSQNGKQRKAREQNTRGRALKIRRFVKVRRAHARAIATPKRPYLFNANTDNQYQLTVSFNC